MFFNNHVRNICVLRCRSDTIMDGEDGYFVEYLNTDEASQRGCLLI